MWTPSVLAPVFYGWREYSTSQGAPGTCRVFYPSLDGAPQGADILTGVGRYPLVVFCHGHCGTGHFRQWLEVTAALARSGYVVLVPQFPTIDAGENPSRSGATEPALLNSFVTWVRQSWELRTSILSGNMGIVGHSYGALLAAKVASTNSSYRAFASLSGVWDDWQSGSLPINSLTIPKLFMHGGDSDTQALLDSRWSGIPQAKHRAVFRDGEHFDYLPEGRATCQWGWSYGPCHHIPQLTRDLVATFMGKYLPPELVPNLGQQIPLSLKTSLQNLTNEQKMYAGNHLTSWPLIAGSSEGCHITLQWSTSSGTGSLVVEGGSSGGGSGGGGGSTPFPGDPGDIVVK